MNKKKLDFLKKNYKKEKSAKVKERILMLVYTFQGESSRDVGDRIQCDQKLVLYWKKRYEKEGLEGLKTRPKSGKPRIISRRQEANLKKMIAKKDLEKPWTTKRVSGLITEKTGVNYSQRQVTRILNRWNFGLTSGRPMYWHRASEEDITKFGKKNKILQK
ncbi:MAG TPA: helix-turn-helix domain-containing protein [Patescibacteria group bacterium]|nr:helix-turn-helix domain-containing protein [Patescibacteria group bacterium]